MVLALEALATLRGVRELFSLTLVPAFSEGLEYVVVDRAQHPEKTRRDCASCARRTACREICVRRCLPDAPHAFAVQASATHHSTVRRGVERESVVARALDTFDAPCYPRETTDRPW